MFCSTPQLKYSKNKDLLSHSLWATQGDFGQVLTLNLKANAHPTGIACHGTIFT